MPQACGHHFRECSGQTSHVSSILASTSLKTVVTPNEPKSATNKVSQTGIPGRHGSNRGTRTSDSSYGLCLVHLLLASLLLSQMSYTVAQLTAERDLEPEKRREKIQLRNDLFYRGYGKWGTGIMDSSYSLSTLAWALCFP
ncbi:unnamed protein product [Protopolystoma xenopodis]|uniref:Uncharacterized protein n=1 Tax=Protopolystoma xenopodis TaxID=117903 RepID=A0A448X693_9PLAT|nr:unnamed protein product [Protopolystoma xenopodis]